MLPGPPALFKQTQFDIMLDAIRATLSAYSRFEPGQAGLDATTVHPTLYVRLVLNPMVLSQFKAIYSREGKQGRDYLDSTSHGMTQFYE